MTLRPRRLQQKRRQIEQQARYQRSSGMVGNCINDARPPFVERQCAHTPDADLRAHLCAGPGYRVGRLDADADREEQGLGHWWTERADHRLATTRRDRLPWRNSWPRPDFRKRHRHRMLVGPASRCAAAGGDRQPAARSGIRRACSSRRSPPARDHVLRPGRAGRPAHGDIAARPDPQPGIRQSVQQGRRFQRRWRRASWLPFASTPRLPATQTARAARKAVFANQACSRWSTTCCRNRSCSTSPSQCAAPSLVKVLFSGTIRQTQRAYVADA